LERTRVDEAHRLRNAHPDLTGRHRDGDVSGAHPGGEGAQGTVGAGVRVGPDGEIARKHQALLGQQDVLNAHLANVIMMGESLFLGKAAHHGALLCALDVLVGSEVIRHHHDLLRVEDPVNAELLEFAHGDGCRDVVGQHHISGDLH